MENISRIYLRLVSRARRKEEIPPPSTNQANAVHVSSDDSIILNRVRFIIALFLFFAIYTDKPSVENGELDRFQRFPLSFTGVYRVREKNGNSIYKFLTIHACKDE